MDQQDDRDRSTDVADSDQLQTQQLQQQKGQQLDLGKTSQRNSRAPMKSPEFQRNRAIPPDSKGR